MDNTPAPKQTRLLGATIRGVGLVVAVSTRMSDAYALIEGADRVTKHVFLRDLCRKDVVFSAAPYAFAIQTERIGVGTWDEVYTLILAQPVEMELAA